MMSWPWSELGLSGPAQPEEIRHAYALRLKEVHPEEDPEGFQRLHRAYQAARRLARSSGRAAPTPPQMEEPAPDGADLGEDAPSQTQSPNGSQEEPPAHEDSNWDFEALLSQGEESGPEDEAPEEESTWVPPVYGRQKARLRLSDGQKFILFCTVLIFIAILFNLPYWLSESTAAKASASKRWVEDTFQVALVSSPQNRDRDEDRFLYWLEDDPDVRFQVIWEGDGKFRTNYTDVLFFREMQAFARAWPDYPLWFDQEMTDSAGEGAQGGAPPTLFLFQVPLEGAEDFLSALGEKLEQIARADWYDKQPPECLVSLAHGDVILGAYSTDSQNMPSGEELLSFYHQELCFPLLKDLLFEQDVVLWDYASEENLVWANSGDGWVLDQNGWWISCRGTGRDGNDLVMYYFLRDDYAALYCIPGSVLDFPEDMFTLSCTETRTMPCGQALEIYRVL